SGFEARVLLGERAASPASPWRRAHAQMPRWGFGPFVAGRTGGFERGLVLISGPAPLPGRRFGRNRERKDRAAQDSGGVEGSRRNHSSRPPATAQNGATGRARKGRTHVRSMSTTAKRPAGGVF